MDLINVVGKIFKSVADVLDEDRKRYDKLLHEL